MLQIKPGEHGSTFGGNPLGCKVAMEALKVKNIFIFNVIVNNLPTQNCVNNFQQFILGSDY